MNVQQNLVAIFLIGCDKEPTIYRAEYLEKIFPNSENAKTFIIKSNYFNQPTCKYLENWAEKNIKITNKEVFEQYTFLNYDEAITLKNPYLEKEYDVIITDYEKCMMSSRDYQCFICK